MTPEALALLAIACVAFPSDPPPRDPALDGVVAVLRGKAVPPRPARAEVAAAIEAASRRRIPRR
ncbi:MULTISPECIES: hypothetical protein [Methylobacteriaceae]|uniref:hypothetical protein n=1 Tax=Methylobacteriaceae TaxID=119045 RepID=UPI00116CB521|nr:MULTISPECIES: hypothetical protein [Methylobacteriaceae]GEL42904.1 hypothetical protein MEX01_34950 [Methylorubrum extorquens]